MILSGSASAEDAERVASRMVDTVGTAFDLSGRHVNIGRSVGIALAPARTDAFADAAVPAGRADGPGGAQQTD